MEKLTKNSKKFLSFKGKKYALNLDAIKQVCLTPSSEGTREYEISQVYEPDNDGTLAISSKVEHETRANNPQNDMIVYDIVKILVVSILENNDLPERDFQWGLGSTFAINTLLSWGVLEELN